MSICTSALFHPGNTAVKNFGHRRAAWKREVSFCVQLPRVTAGY